MKEHLSPCLIVGSDPCFRFDVYIGFGVLVCGSAIYLRFLYIPPQVEAITILRITVSEGFRVSTPELQMGVLYKLCVQLYYSCLVTQDNCKSVLHRPIKLVFSPIKHALWHS